MKKSTILYIVLGGASLALSGALIPWAISGEQKATTEIALHEASVVPNPNVRGEYLVGEEFESEGLFLDIGGREVAFSDCELSYDFSSGGEKVVTASFEEENDHYEGYYRVTVYAIRHLDIRDKTLTLKSDGTFDASRLIVWAELATPAHEFPRPAEFPNPEDTVAVLSPSQYVFEVKETSEYGFYEASVTAGGAKSSWNHAVPSPDRPEVSSAERILHLENGSGTSDKLTLYCQNSTANFSPWQGEGSNEVTGTYVLESNGNKKQFKFRYRIDGWTSSFLSSEYGEGLVDKQGYEGDGDAMSVEVDGLVFYSRGAAWHVAVLAM